MVDTGRPASAAAAAACSGERPALLSPSESRTTAADVAKAAVRDKASPLHGKKADDVTFRGGELAAGGAAEGVVTAVARVTKGGPLIREATFNPPGFLPLIGSLQIRHGRASIKGGTTIKGRVGSALFIMRGAKIDARGREDARLVATGGEVSPALTVRHRDRQA